MAVSLPHYLRSDASFREKIVGLHPSEDKHDSHFGLQPQFGVPMNVKIRVQLNLIVESTRFNQKIKPFDGTATPLLWLEIVSRVLLVCASDLLTFFFSFSLQSVDGLPVPLKLLYHIAFNIMPHVQTAAIYGLFVLGPLCIALGVLGLFKERRRRTHGPGQTVARSNIVRLAVPLTSGVGSRLTKEFVRYSPINMSLRSKEDV